MYKRLSDNSNTIVLRNANKSIAIFICISFTFFSHISGYAQSGRYPVKRIRAYQHEEIGGVNSGKARIYPKKIYTWIYLEMWAGKKIEVTHFWINQEQVNFRIENISSPVYHPVIKDKHIIIPKSSATVLQLIKTDSSEENISFELKAPIAYKRFPILIRYMSESKIYFLGFYPDQLKKIRLQ